MAFHVNRFHIAIAFSNLKGSLFFTAKMRGKDIA